MRLEFSFDDGAELDVKVASILDDYGFRGTFYVPTNHKMSLTGLKLISNLHEIGGHTTNHPANIKLLDDQDLSDEIEQNRRYLHRHTGQAIKKFCYPKGRFDDRIIGAVQRAGFMQARTTEVLQTEVPKNSFEYGTTVHMYNRKEYGGVDWFDIAHSMFETAKGKEDGYFHLWGHSWEIEKLNYWSQFEELLDYIKNYE